MVNRGPSASSMRARELGRRLLWAQERAGFNGRELSAILGWDPVALSRLLRGRVAARAVDVSALLAVCGVTGSDRLRVLELCEPQDVAGLLRLPDGEHWNAYLAHAAGATRVIEFQPLAVPWAVQTPDYTRALVADSPTVPVATVAEQVAARRAAVELLRLPRVDLLVHECALRIPVGDAAVMAEQLHHLLCLSVRPELSVRVIPIDHGAAAGSSGGFTVMEFDGYDPVVYREHPTGGLFLDHPGEVAAHRAITDRLDVVALDEGRSRDLIGQLAVDLGNDRDAGRRDAEVVRAPDRLRACAG